MAYTKDEDSLLDYRFTFYSIYYFPSCFCLIPIYQSLYRYVEPKMRVYLRNED